MSEPLRTCTICHLQKPLAEFYRNRDGFKGPCILCYRKLSRERQKERRANEPDYRLKRNAQHSKYHAAKVSDPIAREVFNAKSREYKEQRKLIDDSFKATLVTYTENYRARKVSTGTIAPSEWREILKLFGYTCAYCGSEGALEQDHVIPLVSGGVNTATNIVPACVRCNRSKGAKDMLEWYSKQVFFSEERLAKILGVKTNGKFM